MNVNASEDDPLQRCFGGLSEILAAANVSKEHLVVEAIESQLESLLVALDLQRAQLRLPRPIEGLPLEILRTASPSDGGLRLEKTALPLGSDGELGCLTVAAIRKGFPDRSERMLLEVAALKATIALLVACHAGKSRWDSEEVARTKLDLLHQLVDGIAAEVT